MQVRCLNIAYAVSEGLDEHRDIIVYVIVFLLNQIDSAVDVLYHIQNQDDGEEQQEHERLSDYVGHHSYELGHADEDAEQVDQSRYHQYQHA